MKKLLIPMLLAGTVALVTTGCRLALSSEPATVSYSYAGYTPAVYQGYTIMYTSAGVPYYYSNGQIVYIQRTHPRYSYYISHWRSNRARYARWRSWYTRRYRNYRYRRVAAARRRMAVRRARMHHRNRVLRNRRGVLLRRRARINARLRVNARRRRAVRRNVRVRVRVRRR